jgi:hypothetical protein
MSPAKATFEFSAGALAGALEFLKRTRWELRSLRRAHVYADCLRIFDINGDYFEVRGIGFADSDVVPLLQAVNAAFDPASVHEPPVSTPKEFDLGRRYTWAHDRVM